MQYAEINTLTSTTVLKKGAGFFQGIVVNLPATATITVFDSTTASGAVIAGATPFALPPAGSTLGYDCHFTNGLTVQVVGGAGPFSITVSYY